MNKSQEVCLFCRDPPLCVHQRGTETIAVFWGNRWPEQLRSLTTVCSCLWSVDFPAALKGDLQNKPGWAGCWVQTHLQTNHIFCQQLDRDGGESVFPHLSVHIYTCSSSVRRACPPASRGSVQSSWSDSPSILCYDYCCLLSSSVTTGVFNNLKNYWVNVTNNRNIDSITFR